MCNGNAVDVIARSAPVLASSAMRVGRWAARFKVLTLSASLLALGAVAAQNAQVVGQGIVVQSNKPVENGSSSAPIVTGTVVVAPNSAGAAQTSAPAKAGAASPVDESDPTDPFVLPPSNSSVHGSKKDISPASVDSIPSIGSEGNGSPGANPE